MKIVLATRNDHKVSEIQALLAGSGLEVTGLGAFPDLPSELPETGDTFVHNALEKARFVFEHTGLPAIADDSGLAVDALGGGPGVFSKRYSAEGTDAANNAKLLDVLLGREDRTARYRCVIAVVGPKGAETSDGACEGLLGRSPRGVGGFGYDPLFWPVETPGRTMAELTMAEKNAISHRGRAAVGLAAMIRRCV